MQGEPREEPVQCLTCGAREESDLVAEELGWAADLLPLERREDDADGLPMFEIAMRCPRCAARTTIVEGGSA